MKRKFLNLVSTLFYSIEKNSVVVKKEQWYEAICKQLLQKQDLWTGPK